MNLREEPLPHVIFVDRGKRRRRRRAFGLGAGAVVLSILTIAIAPGSLSSSTDRSAAALVDIRLGGSPLQMSSGLGSVWVLTCERDCSGRRSAGQIVRVDSRSGEITQRIGVVDANAFAIGAGRCGSPMSYKLGRLRRRLGGDGAWPDELAEEGVDFFMKMFDGLTLSAQRGQPSGSPITTRSSVVDSGCYAQSMGGCVRSVRLNVILPADESNSAVVRLVKLSVPC